MCEEGANGEPSTPQHCYFSEQVQEETNGLDYCGHETCDSAPRYRFMHRLDQILMAGIDCELRLQGFAELDHDISNFCSDLEHSAVNPPLGLVMVMSRD